MKAGGHGVMKFHDFNEKLREGNLCEEYVKSHFDVIFYTPILKHITYENDPKMQRDGIDFVMSKEEVNFDVKCREYGFYKWNDILLETVSVVETGKPGWFWASRSDIIVYMWQNETKTEVIDGYLLLLPQTREWIKDKMDKYKTKTAHSKRQGGTWATDNIAVPIKDFPSDCLIQILKNKLNLEKQVTFDKWE